MPVDPIAPSYAQGVGFGLGTMATGVQVGASKLYGDLASIGNLVNPVQTVPTTNAVSMRHGMTAHEMGFGGSMMGMAGIGTPSDMLSYDWGQASAAHMGRTASDTLTIGGTYAAGMIGGYGLMAPMFNMQNIKRMYGLGQRAATGMGAARVAGGATSALGFGARAGMTGARMLGGAAVAGGAMLLPGLALDYMMESVVEQLQDRSEIMDYLESSAFRYKPGGFSRGERGDIAEFMMKRGGTRAVSGKGIMSSISDPVASFFQGSSGFDTRFTTGELKGILQQGTQLGMFEGTQDAEDFQKKFKGLTENLRVITKILHQSLSEGLNTMKVLKDMGMDTPGQQLGAVARSSMIGAASGMTAGEMLTTGVQGAQVLAGTGVDLGTGMMANQMSTFAVKTAQGAGFLTSQDLVHAGGSAALAKRMTMGGLQFGQSSLGRGLMMGLSDQGVMGVDSANSFLRGDQDMFGILGRGAEQMSDPETYMKFVLGQSKSVGNLMKAGGGMGGLLGQGRMALMMAQDIAPAVGADLRTTFDFLLKTQLNMPSAERKTLMGMIDAQRRCR